MAKGIGGDWAAYGSAAMALGGNEKASKALGIIHNLAEKKRDRKALKERNTSDIDAFHSASSESGSANDNYD